MKRENAPLYQNYLRRTEKDVNGDFFEDSDKAGEDEHNGKSNPTYMMRLRNKYALRWKRLRSNCHFVIHTLAPLVSLLLSWDLST